MDRETLEKFYVGAALYLDLDSDQVDAILARAGLTAKADSVTDCRAAVRTAVSRETWGAGAAAGRLLFDGDAEKLFTTAEAAEHLGVSPRRVRALARRREVGQQVAGAWLFRIEDLELLKPDPRYRRK